MSKKVSRGNTETKKRIALVSKDLFSQKGYLGTSIEDIIVASGSSKGNLYHHFKSKEGLFLYLIEEQVDEWIEQWSSKEKQCQTVSEKLYGLADHVADELKNPLTKAAEEFRGSETANPEVVKQIMLAVQKQREVFHSVLQEAIDKGEIGGYDKNQLAFILYALFAGLGAARHERKMEEQIELHRMAISIFLHGTTIQPDCPRKVAVSLKEN
ncbi:TetR family transcriptional regulator [Brevibacillus choshinensis]|uniref:TetR family transcriptional regulator n=1 Tax=Brevibacillus choshinensis TaxID=54911 RepID=A0ABR5N578_BRECH|nr:TetR family transcriptional regulator [Brevibacillus choshinensis]